MSTPEKIPVPAIGETADCPGGLLAPYIESERFCRELGISGRTFDRWRRSGKAPPILKIGRRLYVRRSAAEQWLVDQEAGRRTDDEVRGPAPPTGPRGHDAARGKSVAGGRKPSRR
jgi:predicted DNA-binding transcriptional regulator AlpA